MGKAPKQYSAQECEAQARAFKRGWLIKHRGMNLQEALKAVPYGG